VNTKTGIFDLGKKTVKVSLKSGFDTQYKHDDFFQGQFSFPDEYFFWRAS
jgi:hypothetical protein